MPFQTVHRAADKGTSLRLQSAQLPVLEQTQARHRLIDSLWNFEVFVRVRNFLPGLQFIAYERPLCFWQPAMLFSKVGASIIWPNTVVADLA
jgi:hypothetical protein